MIKRMIYFTPLFAAIVSICILLYLSVPLYASSSTLIHEHIFLIDTSGSMNSPRSNPRLIKLRVAVDDYADTIPANGSCRIWIFTFNDDLSRLFDQLIRNTEDKIEAKQHLNRIKAAGGKTYIYKSLDSLFNEVEKIMTDGQLHNFVIHLFTDGDDNQSKPWGGERTTFDMNIKRFVELRDRNNRMVELDYHTLDVDISGTTEEKMIQDTEGIKHIPGLQMPPRPDIELPESGLYDNMPITFVCKTVGNADSWYWDFGDSTPPSDEENPTHTFREPGDYEVRLTAGNSAGKNTCSHKVAIQGGPPHAKFGYKDPEKDKYAGESVFFVDESLGQIETWLWDFGDGKGKSTQSNPEYTFDQPGRFKVVLKLKGKYGSGEYSDFIDIKQRPTLKFSYFPKQPEHEQEIKFTNESVGIYGKWSWDFGDGNTSDLRSPQHTYSKEGTYKVILKGQDLSKEWKTITKLLTVTSGYEPPKAKFTLPVESLDAGEQITVSDQSGGTVYKWQWDMGDGTVIETPQATHAYMKGGMFTITLTVSGPAGKDSMEDQILVRQPKLAFTVRTKEIEHNVPIVIVNESVGDFKDWKWNFGDNLIESSKNPDAHIYKEPGNYTIKLSATGPDGKIQILSKEITVKTSDIQPTASFIYRPEKPEAGEKISFIFDGKGTVTKYEWDMGDGNEPAGSNTINYVFKNPGEYKVILKVSNDSGQFDACEKSVPVADPFQKTQISFRIKKDSETDTDYTIEIENNCTGSIKKYLWDFGDGTTSDDKTPQHTYIKTSQQCHYVISLKIIDQKNQEFFSTESQNIEITVRAKPVIAAKYQYLAAVVLYFIAVIIFKLQPYHKRTFKYQVNDERRKTYKNLTKDKRFLWLEGEPCLDKDPYTDGFEVRMVRNWLLQKKYYFKKLKGKVSATKVNQKPLVNNRLVSNALITIRDRNEVQLTKFDDGIVSWLVPNLCIIVLIVGLLALGLRYLA